MLYKRNESFILKDIAGDHILVARGAAAIDFSAVILFNETGVFIWQQLENPQTQDELAAKLAEKYGVPFATALADLDLFMDKMLAEGMVFAEEE